MNFLKDIGFSVLIKYVGMSLNILTGIMIARLLGPEGKGEIALFLVNLVIISQLYNFGIPEFSILSYGKKIFNPEVILVAGLSYSIFIFFGLSLVVTYLYIFSDYNLFEFAVLLLVGGLLESIATHFRHLMLGFKKIKKYNFNVLIQTVSYLLALLFLYFSDILYVNNVLTILVLSRFIAIIAALNFVFKFELSRVFKQKVAVLNYFKDISKQCYKFFFMGLGATLNQRIVYFFLDNYYSNDKVGVYSVSESFPGLINVASSQISFILYPYITNEKKSGKRLTTIALLLTLSIGIIALIIMSLIGQSIIDFIYGEAFSESYLSMLVIIAALTFYSMNNSITNFLISIGKVNAAAKAVIFSLIILFILLYFLINISFIFASLSVLFVNFIMFIYYMSLFVKNTNLCLKDFVDLKLSLSIAIHKKYNSVNE
ncbi:oligosaccharide flippase family protein [Flavobacteriaceae bacterium]|nr:oligosaccharide flippase family protein [Flavobacteriaceae bacterium]